MKYWLTPGFKALQRAWYAELVKDGFEDAEELVADEMKLRQIAAHPYRNAESIGMETKESYYRILFQKVQGSAFDNDIDRIVLTMFAEGAKVARIVESLGAHGKARCRETVRYIIRRYEMQWGLKSYSPQKLQKRAQRTA